MQFHTTTHLMVDDTTIGDIKVRAESRDKLFRPRTSGDIVRVSGQIDIVYVDLRTDIRHHLCISGKPDEVVAVLMAAAGRILQAQEVAS